MLKTTKVSSFIVMTLFAAYVSGSALPESSLRDDYDGEGACSEIGLVGSPVGTCPETQVGTTVVYLSDSQYCQ